MKYDWQLKLCVGSDLVTPLGCGTVWQRRHRVHQRCEELRTCTIGISSVRYQHQQRTVLLSTALHSDHAVTCPIEDHDPLSIAHPRCVAPVTAYLRWLWGTSSSLGVISCSEDCLRARLAGRGGVAALLDDKTCLRWLARQQQWRPASVIVVHSLLTLCWAGDHWPGCGPVSPECQGHPLPRHKMEISPSHPLPSLHPPSFYRWHVCWEFCQHNILSRAATRALNADTRLSSPLLPASRKYPILWPTQHRPPLVRLEIPEHRIWF